MTLTYDDYNIGHPWYFVLGGSAPSPRYIRDQVAETGQTGYLRADIEQLDRKPEPQRSATLRELRDKVKTDLRKDIPCTVQCPCAMSVQCQSENGFAQGHCTVQGMRLRPAALSPDTRPERQAAMRGGCACELVLEGIAHDQRLCPSAPTRKP